MFGKKILGLVSLLLSSQFLSVAKAEGECTFTYDTGSPAECNVSDGCASNNYYIIYKNAADGTAYSTTSTSFGSKLIKIISVSGATSVCEEITSEVGYFKNSDGNYISRTHDGTVAPVDITEGGCTADNIGLLINDGVNDVLCLDYYDSDNKVTLGFGTSSDKYLLKYHATNGALFTSDSSKTRLVITPTDDNSLTLYTTALDEHGVYCDYATNKVLDRMANFCTGTILNLLYTCGAAGTCTQETSKFAETNDYLVHIGGEYKIYQSSTTGGVTSFTPQTSSDLKIFKKVAEDETYFETITSADFDTYLNGIVAVPSNDYLLYDCHDGKCVVTDGYAKYNSGTPALAFFDKGTGEWSSASSNKITCATSGTDEGNVSLSESNLQLCIIANSATVAATNGKTYYISKGASYIASIVSGNVIASTTPVNGYYLIANDNTLITSSGTVDKLIKCDGTCAEAGSVAVGYYLSGINNGLIKCSTATDASCAIHTVTSGYYPNAVSGKALLLCDGTTSKCEAEDSVDIGYYLNGETNAAADKYTQCTSATACVTVSSFNTECDGAEDIGKIDNTGALCLDGTGTHTATFASSGSYLISDGDNSIFDVTNFGVLKVTSNSIIIETSDITGVCVDSNKAITADGDEATCIGNSNNFYTCSNASTCSAPGAVCNPQTGDNCVNTYYLAAATGSTKVIKTPNGESTGYVFKCGGVGPCTSTSVAGYYVNSKTEAFYCTGSAGQCKLATVSDSVCTANGGLYYVDSNVFLCLDKTGEEAERIKIQLDSLNEGNYIANYESENIFGIVENGYGIVKVDADSAIFNANYDNKMKYVYVRKSNLKVLVRGETCPVDEYGSYDVLEINCTAGNCCPLNGCS